MFQKILVANRGEIAARIFRACRELGVTAVGVYADPDENAAWLRDADEIYPLRGTTAADTYLNQQKILEIAQSCGAEAIHPGYGFLSENAEFAANCADHDVKFIGPSPHAIEVMGSKARAREIARDAGVPVTPGVDGAGKTAVELQAAAEKMGFPVLIKASAGGGGKGMRVVESADEFADALQAAQSEAASSFGDKRVILEKYLTRIHHIEVQILADEHGRILHLYERECSIQRRHQKIIEETPSPNLDKQTRANVCAAAITLARAVDYTNAGTVEFMYTEEGNFYLLEMNTRLQVEHPITEFVTGFDIAQWQIRIAAGEKLQMEQTAVNQRGHAIECRLYAEDPAKNFLPSIGRITHYEAAAGLGIRVDDGVADGSAVTPYYDPMLAKIITYGSDRATAVRKMQMALRDTAVLGVTTNLGYLQAILGEANFQRGNTTTAYLEEFFDGWMPSAPDEDDDDIWLAIAAAEAAFGGDRDMRPTTADGGAAPQVDAWQDTGRWRNVKIG